MAVLMFNKGKLTKLFLTYVDASEFTKISEKKIKEMVDNGTQSNGLTFDTTISGIDYAKALYEEESLFSEPVCGSCGYFGSYDKDKNKGCSFFNLNEVYAKDLACEKYYPIRPIKVFIDKGRD